MLGCRLLALLGFVLSFLSFPAGAHAAIGALTDDGVQTWFNDQRAVVHDGKLFTGAVRADGSVAAVQYDPATGGHMETVLHRRLEVDDHNNPGIEVLPDGRLAYFYTAHSEDELLRYRITRRPGDISVFGREHHRDPTPGPFPVAYANPIHLADEGRLYVFTRNSRRQPTVVFSDDGAKTWSQGREVFVGDPGAEHRPYLKYADNGRNRIDFFATWGHPGEIPVQTSDLFHFYYDSRDASFHRTDGTTIRTLAAVLSGAPLTPADVTQIHDATGDGNGWTWSVATDAAGRPVVTYAVYKTMGDHRYRYARWTGTRWEQHEIARAGGTLSDGESFYSGGVVLDPADTSRVFLSREVVAGTWELERWTTADGGETWSSVPITSGSGAVRNFRPFVPEHRTAGIPEVMWVRGDYHSFTDYATGLYGEPMRARVALPQAVVAPAIVGSHAYGQSLRAIPGTWRGADGTRLQWTRDGVDIPGATGETHTVRPADADALIGLRVTGRNAAGTRSAEAEPVEPAFDPASVAGLQAWYRADVLPAADGAPVAAWPDLSGNARALTQPTPGKQPVYASAPTGFGGRPAVFFDSEGDGSGMAGAAAALAQGTVGVTVFAVAKTDFQPSTPRTIAFIPGPVSGSARLSLESGRTTGAYQVAGRRTDRAPLAVLSGGEANAEPFQLTGVVDYRSALASVRVDGREVARAAFGTPGTSSNTASAGLRLGANGALNGGYWGGHIAEVLIYHGALGAADVQEIEGYLRRKYRLGG